jgi:hypothetical protein
MPTLPPIRSFGAFLLVLCTGTLTAAPAPRPTAEEYLAVPMELEGFDVASWPGGDSGVTIGHGYDLGYHTRAEFRRAWEERLDPEDFVALSRCVGLSGAGAGVRAAQLRGRIRSVTIHDADHVFREIEWPSWRDRTAAAMPGFDALPPRARTALVSVAYNRGLRMTDIDPELHDRREMRQLRAAVARHAAAVDCGDVVRQLGSLGEMARVIRRMKRLWRGRGLDGLLHRREVEASLVDAARAAMEEAMKAHRVNDSQIAFWCPGCNETHIDRPIAGPLDVRCPAEVSRLWHRVPSHRGGRGCRTRGGLLRRRSLGVDVRNIEALGMYERRGYVVFGEARHSDPSQRRGQAESTRWGSTSPTSKLIRLRCATAPPSVRSTVHGLSVYRLLPTDNWQPATRYLLLNTFLDGRA